MDIARTDTPSLDNPSSVEGNKTTTSAKQSGPTINPICLGFKESCLSFFLLLKNNDILALVFLYICFIMLGNETKETLQF
jgi:hypothetical protein